MKAKFTLLFLTYLISFTAGAQVNLDAGVVAYYPFDGIANDTTSNALNLTPYGSPANSTDRFGNPAAAYLFDAGNFDYLDGGFSNLLSPTELTLAAWINLNDAFPDQKIAGKADVGGGGYLMGVDTNKLDAEIWDQSSTHYRLKGGSVLSAIWNHVAITFKANDYLRIFVNGVAVDSLAAGTFGAGVASNPFIVAGAPWQPTALNISGSIDDLILYNRALSNDEVYALYNHVSTSIIDAKTNSNSKIYPVPANGNFLNIDFSKKIKENISVKIANLNGQILLIKNYENPVREMIDISALKSGIYSVVITGKENVEVKRIEKL